MNHIITRTTKEKGVHVCLLVGVHGDELVGKKIYNTYKKCKPKTGSFTIILANPPAVRKKVRFIEKDMNRCFFNTRGTSYEEIRARHIRKVLAQCDVVIDIHSYDPKWKINFPFIICEDPSISIASLLGIKLITTNWKKFHHGSSDFLMYRKNKVGICIETGPHNQLKKNYTTACQSIDRLLEHFCQKKKTRRKIVVPRIVQINTLPFNKDGMCTLRKVL